MYAYEFMLAERLHMTHRMLRTRMGIDELYEWVAFDSWREDAAKFEAEKAEMRNG